ncbi:ADP-glyceromanno-heptose 6-epimerase [Candidatus Woesearchaeota archaeon]|nr:ADP-glyceromanno-heptose 6-epimerase [Candidatus Woesearchaeota archaeon]
MKCVITGGAGFIGSNLVKELERQNHETIVIDDFSSGHKDNLETCKGVTIEQDVSKPFTVEGNIDAIFHIAAITDPRYEEDARLLEANVKGFQNILELAKEKKAKLVYASTAGLYGNGPAPQKEDQAKEITTAYAESKLIIDEMASHHYDDLQVVGLRYFNVFGPGETHKGRPASMIYHLIKQMRQGKRPKLFKHGEHKRDHIYVKDVVKATIKALDAKSGVYNVGTGIGTSFNELIAAINKALGTNLQPEYIDSPYDMKTYQHHTEADTTRAKKHLKFEAEYSLIDGIKDYLPQLK